MSSLEPQPEARKGNGGRMALPTAGVRGEVPELQSVLSVAELAHRPTRPPDYASENHALLALAEEMAVSPDGVLQKLADTALALCRAHSAGLSLLEDADQRRRFHWRAVAGVWAQHAGGGTPRDFGPCGTVLDRNVALLFSHPERDFPYFGEVKPYLEEGLLIPFYVRGEAVGTVWVVAHDESRRFDAEDLRVMTNLATFAAAAYQNLRSLNATQEIAAIVESSQDAIVSKGLDGIIRTWNRGAERLFGYTADEIVGRSVTTLIPADRLDEEQSIIARIERGERVDQYETLRRRKDGSLVPIFLTVSPVKNARGEIVGASKIAHDISERKQKEERIALLAREIDHRSKNLLGLVKAIVHLAEGETPAALKSAIAGRVEALAGAHSLLARSQWVGADIRDLVTEELSPYCAEGEERASLRGPSLILKPKSAQAAAIALHELTTNAVKYGALSVRSGQVQVEWSQRADGKLAILWTESGGPPVSPPSHRGFGSRVIQQIIQGELNGTVSYDWRKAGLACQLAIDPAVEA